MCHSEHPQTFPGIRKGPTKTWARSVKRFGVYRLQTITGNQSIYKRINIAIIKKNANWSSLSGGEKGQPPWNPRPSIIVLKGFQFSMIKLFFLILATLGNKI